MNDPKAYFPGILQKIKQLDIFYHSATAWSCFEKKMLENT